MKRLKIIAITIVILIALSPFVTCYAEQPVVRGKYEVSTRLHKTTRNNTKQHKTCNLIELPVYDHTEFKAYMDGQCITCVGSDAYKQISKMTINENGLYCEGKFVGIAMNRFYGKIGDKFRITLSSGQVFYGVLTDLKQDQHVDENYADSNGGIIEFVVDTCLLPGKVLTSGSLNSIYRGKVERIERYEKGEETENTNLQSDNRAD